MPAVIYTKSKLTDFSNNLLEHQLHQEIDNNQTITKTLLRIDTVDDVVKIVFNDTLTGGEETELNSIISVHNPVANITAELATLNPKGLSYKSSSYETLIAFHYLGSSVKGAIKRVTFVGYKDSTATDYIFRVYDVTNRLELGSITCTNNDEVASNSITSFTNMPSGPATLEFQGKKTGGTSASKYYIDTIQIYV